VNKTGKKGRYSFLVKKGIYQMFVEKNGFSFPSTIIKANKDTSDYNYLGEIFNTSGKTIINYNIPLDNFRTSKNPTIFKMAKLNFERKFAYYFDFFAITSFVIGLYSAFEQERYWLLMLWLAFPFIRVWLLNRGKHFVD
jgi:hypothetical protein